MEPENELYTEKLGEELKNRMAWFKEALQDETKKKMSYTRAYRVLKYL